MAAKQPMESEILPRRRTPRRLCRKIFWLRLMPIRTIDRVEDQTVLKDIEVDSLSEDDNPPHEWHAKDWIGCGKTNPGLLSVPEPYLSIIPDRRLAVQDLLRLKLPSQSAAFTLEKAETCFSTATPGTDLTNLAHCQIPPKPFLASLETAFGQAWLDGKKSIKDPWHKGVKLPLWMITFWQEMALVIQLKAQWREADEWLAKPCVGPELEAADSARQLLQSLEFGAPLRTSNSNTRTDSLTLLLSDRWFNCVLVDMCMAQLAARVRLDVTLSPKVIVASLHLEHRLKLAFKTKTYGKDQQQLLHHYERAIKENGRTRLFFPAHINENHWVPFEVDFERREIQYGDSLSHAGNKPRQMILALQSWFKERFNGSFTCKGDTLTHGRQQDTLSCGVCMQNTIAHALFGDPIFTHRTRRQLRMQNFTELASQHNQRLLVPTSDAIDPVPERGILDHNFEEDATTADTGADEKLSSVFIDNKDATSTTVTTSQSSMRISSMLNPMDTPVAIPKAQIPISSLLNPSREVVQIAGQPPHHSVPIFPMSEDSASQIDERGLIDSTFSDQSEPAASWGDETSDILSEHVPLDSDVVMSEGDTQLETLKLRRMRQSSSASSQAPSFKRRRTDKAVALESSGTTGGSSAPNSSCDEADTASSASEAENRAKPGYQFLRPRPRPLVLPGQGTSKSAVASQKMKKAKADGTFKPNETRIETYKRTVFELDADAEFARGNLMSIRHSKCGMFFTTKDGFSVGRFAEHVKACKAKGKALSLFQFATRGWGGNVKTEPNVTKPNKGGPTSDSDPETTDCHGITPQIEPLVEQYLNRTGAPGGGATSITKIALTKYKKLYSKLTARRKKKVDLLQYHEQKWRNEHDLNCVFAAACHKTFSPVGKDEKLCPACTDVLKSNKFRNACRLKPPDADDMKYMNYKFRNKRLGELYARTAGLQELVEMKDAKDAICVRFAIGVVQGKYKNREVFTGLVKAMVVVQERQERGVGMQNFEYAPALDEFAHAMATISPQTYRFFSKEFQVRGERSFKKLQAKTPRFPIGITDQTFKLAKDYVQSLNYLGPLSLSCDDTKLHPALKMFWDPIKNCCFLLGGIGEPMAVANARELESVLRSQLEKATKIRLWCLSIPLPNVPPLILAAKAIPSNMKSQELYSYGHAIISGLVERGLRIISYACDGTETERAVQRLMVSQSERTVTYSIAHPCAAFPDVKITLATCHGQCLVMIQDSKHALKTRNNIFSVSVNETSRLANFPEPTKEEKEEQTHEDFTSIAAALADSLPDLNIPSETLRLSDRPADYFELLNFGPAARSTRASNAKIHGLTKVTPRTIACAAIQKFDYAIVELDDDDDPWRTETLAWWDQHSQFFGDTENEHQGAISIQPSEVQRIIPPSATGGKASATRGA
ncbi:hypothetical protein BD410DRAFT_809111 [Rickenella mellea]|uniref:Ubiquitin-like protease family profile domain-containing protein n=1 Tax=Rickenella mellea TaxID=50990 RepID=A0A4Y7PJP2_9AGAM|nr:hypothetical protein BD410DRAFT_809111 [Rickenella mellea]